MSRIAIISDVHGNLPALETVLIDINNRNIDQIYCLGDLVDFAPWNNEVIQKIKTLRIPCLMGNHDERIAFDLPIVPLAKHDQEERNARVSAISFSKNTITDDNKYFLKNLPRQIQLTFQVGLKKINIVLVHGSTRSNQEYIYEDHDALDLQQMMSSIQADVLIMGHTHLPYIQYLPCGLAINCGSVGRSKEKLKAAVYLLMQVEEDGISLEIVRVQYEVQQTIDGIKKSGIPDFYADFLTS